MNIFDSTIPQYIGVTDFMRREQTLEMLEFYHSLVRDVPSWDIRLMVGVMMGYKTLHGQETKWAQVFPKNDAVSSIFVRDPLLLNTLHYADYTNTNVVASLVKAIRLGGDAMDALQLDMTWPRSQDLAEVHYQIGRKMPIILQVGKDAMEEEDNSPMAIIVKLQEYADVIEGVLFDRSMGQGKVMNQAFIADLVHITHTLLPNLTVACAGGIGPKTLHVVEPVISRCPYVSVDAQGKLRPSESVLDPLDFGMVREYLEGMVNFYRTYKFKQT